MKKVFIFLVSAFALFVLPIQSLAQPSESGIQISPVTYNYEISPGGTKSAAITLKNLSKEEVEYTIETENFANTNTDGAPVFAFGPAKEGVVSLANWFSFPEGKVGKIPAEGSVEVGFKISIPEGAEPGGHYAAVFAKVIAKTEEGKTELGVSSRVGTLFLVNVPGEVRYGVEIENLTVPKFVWRGPIDLGMQVKNTGTVHYDSQADITLKGVLIGGEAKVDMGQHTILPDSSRAYKGEWESKYPFGIYKVTASATGGEASPVTQSTTVYAIPIIIVLPIIIAIILIAIIARSLKKKYKIVSK